MHLYLKLLELVDRQVNPPAQCVFTHVADDVGELQGLAEFVRVSSGLGLRLAEDASRHFTHDAGNKVTVTLQARVVEVAGLGQVHLAAFNDGLQVALLDLEISS